MGLGLGLGVGWGLGLGLGVGLARGGAHLMPGELDDVLEVERGDAVGTPGHAHLGRGRGKGRG